VYTNTVHNASSSVTPRGNGGSEAGGAQAAKPVMVWVYGGGSVNGNTTSYGPIQQVVTDLDVVLVATNYRLGSFGYLALRELSETDPRGANVSGNYGVMGS
jgi:para-nitrobenzyl esterase